MDSNIDLVKSRKLLLQKKHELQEGETIGNLSAGTVELDQTRMGRLSRMDALQGQAMSMEAKRRREVGLKRIDIALQKIEAGNYGLCLSCGEPIATRRLEVDPATSFCIDCAE